MSETAYIDELLKAEQSANEIISNAQRERYVTFYPGNVSSNKPRKLLSRRSTNTDSRRRPNLKSCAKG